MPVLLLSTCGTSLLTNEADGPLKKILRDTANDPPENLSPEKKSMIDAHVSIVRDTLLSASQEKVRQMSAELNGILACYDGKPASGLQDIHYLLHTDTYQGLRTAELVKDWLEQHSLKVQLLTEKGLHTGAADSFRHALSELVKWCEETLPGCSAKKYKIVFALVGGFKALNGFLQALGMCYADETIYLFENKDAPLLRIPRLPFNLDAGVEDHVREHLALFRRLCAHQTLPPADCAAINEIFLYNLGNECELSPWGRLIWEKCRPKVYCEKVHPSPSNLIRFSKKFEQDCSKLAPDRLAHVNERMDDLALYLESDKKSCINRLDFKALKGKPRPPSTHECDAWGDSAAWRIFGHFEKAVFVLDHLGEGLH
jgi:putative CRISPR-associated protein (TIGR02619 family)